MNRLAVIGAGMQGVAAAYDCILFGSFDRVVLADVDVARAIDGSERLNRLFSCEACEPARIDATSESALQRFLPDFEVAISALPYKLHSLVEQVGIATGCSVVDMGQDVEPALSIHAMSDWAREREVAVVTDCGLAPGLVSVLAMGLLDSHSGSHSVRAYCGGLPVQPVGPLGYVLRFSLDSVIGEYSDDVLELRDGSVVTVPALEDRERIDFDGVGRLEAFTTSGGTGTAPFSFVGRVENYTYKTLRYPGHLDAMRIFRDCGFWEEEKNDTIQMSPRQAFTAILEPSLRRPDIADMVLVRVEAEAEGRVRRIEMIEQADGLTGFTAMERLTGFATSIVALEIASGNIGWGCAGCETAVDARRFREQLALRNFSIREEVFDLGLSPASA